MDSSSDSEERTNKKRDRDKPTGLEGKTTYKKARYGWQIKGEKKGLSTSCASTSEGHNFIEHKTVTNPDTRPSGENQETCGLQHFSLAVPTVGDDGDTESVSDSVKPKAIAIDHKKFDTAARRVLGSVRDILADNSNSEILNTDLSIQSDPDEGNSDYRHEQRIRYMTGSYWERQAPFDVLRTTVNIAASSHCLWQKQELGCAIVDNVFNKTLEEIGISPDPKVNKVATFIERALENQGIESAIRHQGLRSNVSVRQLRMPVQTNRSTEVSSTMCTQSSEESNKEGTHFVKESDKPSDNVSDQSCDSSSDMIVTCSHTDNSYVHDDHCSDRNNDDNEMVNKENIHVDQPLIHDAGTLGSFETMSSEPKPNVDECAMNSHEMDCSTMSMDYVKATGEELQGVGREADMPGDEDVTDKPSCSGSLFNNSINQSNDSSENMLDLAVSTAILTQGLAMKTD